MSAPQAVLSDLPAYPGRIAPARDGGFWLALFAPRNQLVEFVLREDTLSSQNDRLRGSELLDRARSLERRELS